MIMMILKTPYYQKHVNLKQGVRVHCKIEKDPLKIILNTLKNIQFHLFPNQGNLQVVPQIKLITKV